MMTDEEIINILSSFCHKMKYPQFSTHDYKIKRSELHIDLKCNICGAIFSTNIDDLKNIIDNKHDYLYVEEYISCCDTIVRDII
jgi:hypothetical protein